MTPTEALRDLLASWRAWGTFPVETYEEAHDIERAAAAAEAVLARLPGPCEFDGSGRLQDPCPDCGHPLEAHRRPDKVCTICQNPREETGWAGLVADLDRCEHGRHQGDVCSFGPGGSHGCGGPSRGNPLWSAEPYYDEGSTEQRLAARFGADTPERLIGFSLSARPICVPERKLGPAPTPKDYYR